MAITAQNFLIPGKREMREREASKAQEKEAVEKVN